MIINIKYDGVNFYKQCYVVTYGNVNNLPESELKAALLKECENKIEFLFDASICLIDEKTACYSGYTD